MTLGELPEAVRDFRYLVTEIVNGTDNEIKCKARLKYSIMRESPNSIETSLYVCENIADETLKFYALEIIHYHIRLNHEIPDIANFILTSLYGNNPRFLAASRIAAINCLSSMMLHDFSLLQKIPFDHPDAIIFFEKIPKVFSGIYITSQYYHAEAEKIRMDFLTQYFSIQVPDIYAIHHLLSLREFFLPYDEPPEEIINSFIELSMRITEFPDIALAFKVLEDFTLCIPQSFDAGFENPTDFTRAVLLFSVKFAHYLLINQELHEKLPDFWNMVVVLPSPLLFDQGFPEIQNLLKMFFKSIPLMVEKGNSFQEILIRFCERLNDSYMKETAPELAAKMARKVVKILLRYGVMIMQCHIPAILEYPQYNLPKELFYGIIEEGIFERFQVMPASIFKTITSLPLAEIPQEIIDYCFGILQNGNFYQDYASLAFHFLSKMAQTTKNPAFEQVFVSKMPLINQILSEVAEAFPSDTFCTVMTIFMMVHSQKTFENFNFWLNIADTILSDASSLPPACFAHIFSFECYYITFLTENHTEELSQIEHDRCQALLTYLQQIDDLGYFSEMVNSFFGSQYINEISMEVRNIIVMYISSILTSSFGDFTDILKPEDTDNHCFILSILTHLVKYLAFEESIKIVQCIDKMLSVFTTSYSFKFLITLAFSDTPVTFDNSKMVEISNFLIENESCLAYFKQNSEFFAIMRYFKQLENFSSYSSVEEWLLASGLEGEEISNMASLFHQLYKVIIIFRLIRITEYLQNLDVASCDISLLNEISDFCTKSSKFISFRFNWMPTRFVVQLFSNYNEEELKFSFFVAQMLVYTRVFDFDYLEEFVSAVIRSLFTFFPVDQFYQIWMIFFYLYQHDQSGSQLFFFIEKALQEKSASNEALCYFHMAMESMQNSSSFREFMEFLESSPNLSLACDKFYLWRQLRA
ncbi:hypothetical protein TVAG_391570 [Trichomonas vaginalis G3]|uniref:Uncharacterized protein n=1 Tax=Trichomonas vaginalis (strain ATCC PRA-98 / G3) TaxID=412133 RepID=A2DFS0_TRIV3|nr:hypothetical protein TVAGG3_0323100 [Trichomonas vaginalis G3]EAY20773.1 hypothetical protein TVAG_391570 [Trichomonas vaginalis G3]KAI5529442.1 hypothetical protein TVAGG3_0323100 [Trichomonas vaginalis G3]|eukprot:XP_001581759.1 hypothetical protein [Trichomonas vaginalis G3]